MDDAIDQREERVILADADIFAGHDSSTALANDDLAGRNFLSISALNAEILRI